MSYKLSIYIALLLVIVTVSGCQLSKQGDTHPEIPLLSTHTDQHITIRHLPEIELIQFVGESKVHAFGANPTGSGQAMLQYDEHFVLQETTPIGDLSFQRAFVDDDSNLFVWESREMSVYNFPDYVQQAVSIHPVFAAIQAELDQELLPASNSKNFEQYRQLKNGGQEDQITQTNADIARRFVALLLQALSVEDIDYVYPLGNTYLVAMRDGSYRYLPNVQTANGKVSVRKYFDSYPELSKYGGTAMLRNQSKNLRKIGYSTTVSANIRESRPNSPYKFGYHYYQLTLGEHKTRFKVEDHRRNSPVRELSDEEYSYLFLNSKGNWYLVQAKQ